MICYLIRHGQDDDTRRGGWSSYPLNEEGISQVEQMAEKLSKCSVHTIYSSDLCRAMQTAQILAEKLRLPVTALPQFREVNNGELAGMKNELALERYPGLFWNRLEWEQCYPNGESPRQFYERISFAWREFSQNVGAGNENVALVTHGGVMQVICSILENRHYNNQEKQRKIDHAQVITLICENGVWSEQEL